MPALVSRSGNMIDCSHGQHLASACYRSGGATLILSNNHVLADENRAKAGDPIIQPGDLDGGKDQGDRVGTLQGFIRLKRSGGNLVCTVDDNLRYSTRRLTGLGRLAGVGPEVLDEREEVAKVGRTTGITRGRVTAFEIDNLVVAFASAIFASTTESRVWATGLSAMAATVARSS
jgi:hypothetical protein